MSEQKKKRSKNRVLQFLEHLVKDPLSSIYLVFVLLIVIGSIVVYNVETKTGSGIETKFDTFWFMCVAVFAGYFEFVCESLPGRTAAITMLIVGTILFSFITGKVASTFIDIQMKNDRGLKKIKKMSGHFILCGWREGFENILENVLKSNAELTPDMIVLVNEAPEQIEQIRSDIRFKEVKYVNGDFTDEATLKRAHLENAERVLVISDRSKKYSDLEIDSRTVLAVMTMESMCRGIYIAAELLSARFEKHLKMSHCDEIILTQEYEQSLLATASSAMGYSNVIRSLLSDDADSGILIYEIAASDVGTKYGDFKEKMWKKRAEKGVLIGLLLNSGNYHMRRAEAIREAQKNPNVNIVISDLKKVKSLKSNDPLLKPANDFIIPKNARAIFVKGKVR